MGLKSWKHVNYVTQNIKHKKYVSIYLTQLGPNKCNTNKQDFYHSKLDDIYPKFQLGHINKELTHYKLGSQILSH